MTNNNSRKRTVITDDGELEDIDIRGTDSNAQPVYCNECGTRNAPNAKFCGKCGHSLIDQEAQTIGTDFYNAPADKGKGKRLAAPTEDADGDLQQALSGTGTAAMKLPFFAGMAITSIIFGQPWAIIPVLIAWFMSEVTQSGRRRHWTTAGIGLETSTLALITGMVIPSYIFGHAWAAIPVLVAWTMVQITSGEKRERVSTGEAASRVSMLAVITGVVVISYIFSVSWIVIPALVVWFLMEVTRS